MIPFSWNCRLTDAAQAELLAAHHLKSRRMQFIKNLTDKLAAMNKSRDPTEFKDEIASRTQWDAFRKATGNFNTHKLVDKPGYGMAYKPAAGFYFLTGMFMFLGGITTVTIIGQAIQQSNPLNGDVLFPAAFGLVFFIIGICLFRFMARPIVFDSANRSMDLREDRTYFSDMYAIQLIVQRGSKHRNYQVNLVMRNADRVHVMNYADSSTARTDAARIADVTGISPDKIWDTLPGYNAPADGTIYNR